jgi:hypothetical protein
MPAILPPPEWVPLDAVVPFATAPGWLKKVATASLLQPSDGFVMLAGPADL